MEETNRFYVLPKLSFDYRELEPHISGEQLKIHHQKHHQGYVKGANAIFGMLEKSRKEGKEIGMKSTLKALSFNIGGHILHSLFWNNLAPEGKGGNPEGSLLEALEKEFGSFDRFKEEFSQAAVSVEGSGWAALALDEKTQRPVIMQIEKHTVNTYPTFKILLVLDVWEHAYYLDYKNARARFVEAFWSIVNWNEVSKRLEEAIG
ncbi:MAG: superoxide dismutase [Candidatus Aenigmatarchaeota archaeon]